MTPDTTFTVINTATGTTGTITAAEFAALLGVDINNPPSDDDSKGAYVDYRIVPGYGDHSVVLSELNEVLALGAFGAKFYTDGAAIAATFDADDDPRAAVNAVAERHNLPVMRHTWGSKPWHSNTVSGYGPDCGACGHADCYGRCV